ncbi:MAG TPA: TonB-dependent receptor [Terriglobales bacterium]|nr:TonB-dependent receptor [Terriglobales bacterium]
MFALLLLAGALAGQQPPADLAEMSLEDLMNIRVTSVARREQTLLQTAAAVYVISAEDIRRSGVTNLPDALRLAPGVEVAQVSSDAWAVSIRGFNAVHSNKLLVLVDGRSVYSSTFSGVYWNKEDLMLENVDRIEVIRGPGGAIWGSNAVNGVINIITKPAGETAGTVLTVGGGSYERGLAQARYGGAKGGNLEYRIYGKYFNRNSLGGIAGLYEGASWDVTRGGFRADWRPREHDSVMAEGNMYRGQVGQLAYQILPGIAFAGPAPLVESSGGDGLLRWKHVLAGGSELTTQAYYDRTHQGNFLIGQNENVADLDFQYDLPRSGRHDVIWGAGFRSMQVHSSPMAYTRAIIQPHSTLHLFSTFAQDEIAIVGERLWATTGCRVEHNDYTGWEVQPNLRLLWKPRPRQAAWAAVSRAVRTPSVYEVSIRVPAPVSPGVPVSGTLLGNPDLQAESVLAYEAGYRVQATPHVTLDAATFYNRYRHLISYTPIWGADGTAAPELILKMTNGVRGETYGGEIAATYVVSRLWSVQGSYSLFRGQWGAGPGDRNAVSSFVPGQTPRHQFQIRSALSPLREVAFDTNLFYVSGWTAYPLSSQTRLDTRVGWKASKHVEFDVVIQNALQPRHAEFFSASYMGGAELVKRAVFGKMTLQF